MTQFERAIIGLSEAVEAEYGMCADAPFTLAIADENGDIFSIEGFQTLAAAKREALEGGFSAKDLEVLT